MSGILLGWLRGPLLASLLTFLHITGSASDRALSACKAGGECVQSPARGLLPIIFWVKIMRIVLTTVLMAMAAVAWADEPSASDHKAEAKAEQAADTAAAAKPDAQANTATPAAEDDKPFKPPQGYKAKRVNGEQVYCTKVVVLGSRFPKEDCRTQAQLRDLEAQKASMRGGMDQSNRVCASAAGCANN